MIFTYAYIFSHKYSSNIANSLYNYTLIFKLEICSKASNFKQINSQVTLHNSFNNSTNKENLSTIDLSIYHFSHIMANCYFMS